MKNTSVLLRTTAAIAVVVSLTTAASAVDLTVGVWAVATPFDSYRVDAIEMAADILERESAIRGEELNITVEKTTYEGWDEFKQALTLSAEAGTAPDIVVTGHEDIAPWSQSGLIVPVQDYVDLDAWPLSDIYPNLIDISSYGGTVYGIPQDAESRPFFFYKPHMLAIGYTEADLDALPQKIADGTYTLANVLEDAKKMQDAGVVEAGYGFYPRVSKGLDYWQFYTSFGGAMEEDGKLVFDKAAMTKFYQFFVDAVAAGVTKKNHIGTPWEQWYPEVALGKAGIWHGGTWHYAQYLKEGQQDFFGNIAFTLIPSGGDGGKANTLTHPLVYLLTSGHDEAQTEVAAQLVTIASEPRINTLHAIKSAHLGIAASQSGIDLYSQDRWAREATEALLPHANAIPNNVDFTAYFDIMWNELEAAWTGTKTVEQAVADAEKDVTSALGDRVVVR
jgi:inositol-phosphate transport system substrate-binding protein